MSPNRHKLFVGLKESYYLYDNCNNQQIKPIPNLSKQWFSYGMGSVQIGYGLL